MRRSRCDPLALAAPGLALLALVVISCQTALPGNDFHDDFGVSQIYIAVPCEIAGQVDASSVPVDGTTEVVLVCEEADFPAPVGGSSVVLHYIDYVGDAGGFGLREAVLETLSERGIVAEFAVFDTYCGETIEFGGWSERPGGSVDLGQIRVSC